MNKKISYQRDEFIREIYNTKDFIPLHEPKFIGNEKKYLNECIDSTFVSSVGAFVDKFEKTGFLQQESFKKYIKILKKVEVKSGSKIV